MTSTGCSDQGALRLKLRRPNEHLAMYAKPSTQPPPPTFSSQQATPEVLGKKVQSSASQVATGHQPQTVAGPTAIVDLQPILLRLPVVMRITGLARSTIYRLVSQNQFPVPIKLSARAVAWLHSEIEGWIASRGRTH